MRVDLSRVKVDWRTAAPVAFVLVDGAAVDVMRLGNWTPKQFLSPDNAVASGFSLLSVLNPEPR